MRKDKACRLVKGEQPLFIFQNQIVGGNIVTHAPLFDRIHDAVCLFVDGKIPLMRILYVDAFQIFDIRADIQRDIVVENADIFLLEHFSEIAEQFVAVLVVLAVMCDFVDKEQRKALDTHVKQLFFLFKVRKDGFAYLNTPHIPFGNIAAHLSDRKRLPVQKRDRIVERVYFFNHIAVFVLFERRHIRPGRHRI